MSENQGYVEEVSQAHAWFEMPVASDTSPDEPPCPPFECEGEATYVYRDSLVYAKFADPRDEQEAEKVPRSRRRTAEEVRALDADMPFPYLEWMSQEAGSPEPAPRYFGVGDAVSWLLHKLGFSECSGCRKRKGWLNRIPLWPRHR
jgi:hypothetical protein